MVKILPPYKINTPEYKPGSALSIMPSGHQLWLHDYFYYDQLGRDPMQLRKLWLIEDTKERLEKFKKIVEEYPTAKHRRNMLYTVIDRNDEECVRHLVSTGLLIQPDIEQAKKDKDAYEESRLQPDFEDPDSPMDIADPDCSPAHLAAFQGKLDLVKILLEDGKTEVDCRDQYGRTLLHNAAGGNHPEVVRFLLGEGADPTIRTYTDKDTRNALEDYAGADPLEMAVGQGNSDVEIIRMLLEHPFHGSTRKRKWTENSDVGVWVTPLTIKAAAGNRNFEALKFLLERGGLPIEDANGQSKGDLLSESERELVIELVPTLLEFADFESLNFMLSYIYPTDDKGGVLPFPVPDEFQKPHTYGTYSAVASNDLKKFRFLHGFKIKEHDTMSLDELPEGQTVNIQSLFEKAATYGALECAKVLVDEFGADPNKHRFPAGTKPLYAAAAHDQTELVRWLIEDQKVDVHASSGRFVNGPTALWIAISLRSVSCVELLLLHGGPLDHIDEDLRHLEKPVTAILSARKHRTGGTTICLETEANAKEFVESARNDFMDPISNYLRVELVPEDRQYIQNLVLRHPSEKLRDDEGQGKYGPPREVNSKEGSDDKNLERDDPRFISPPIPTFKARERLVRSDDDLYPEFRPFMVPGWA